MQVLLVYIQILTTNQVQFKLLFSNGKKPMPVEIFCHSIFMICKNGVIYFNFRYNLHL